MSFFLAMKLRKASDTQAIEKKRDELRSDFEEFETFTQSEELKLFNELEKQILSSEFKQKKKEIESKKYKGSSLFKVEKDLARLEKSKKLKTYLSVKGSSELSTYELLKNSDEMQRFLTVEKKVKSSSFDKKENASDFEEYKSLKDSARFKSHFKFEQSKEFKIYQEVVNSDDVKKLETLKEKTRTEEFLKEKEFLLNKKRFETTEEFKKEQEYLLLKTSDKFKKYFKLKEKNLFDRVKDWELTFSDEFEGSKLDVDKWIPRYYWGEQLMNQAYSQAEELSAYTDGDNIELLNSSALLQAKKEVKESLAWDAKMGFVPRKFDYTSAIISSGKAFKQKYGLFEAKVRIKNPEQAQHAFWLVGEQQTPHINVIKTEKGKIHNETIWGEGTAVQSNERKVKGVDLNKGYYIYSLEWNQNELIWRVNDIIVKRETQGVPQEEMYLNFSLGVKEEQNNMNSAMEIDWVRCYQKKK